MTGFNRDCNIRSVYGKETYFSNIAIITAHYCNQFRSYHHELKYMLFCSKVYIGRYDMMFCYFAFNGFMSYTLYILPINSVNITNIIVCNCILLIWQQKNVVLENGSELTL